MNEKLLQTIQEDVYMCSKCGLCQSVCPLYLAYKNEMFLPRGRYIVINNFFNNNKPLTKQFIKNIDFCLNCNACKSFCPSDIDIYNINTVIKNAVNYKYSFFSFSFVYKIILNLYRLIPYKKITVRRKKVKSSDIKGKVIYFEGCYNNYINPSDKNAVLNLIESLNYKTEKILSFCCGYPYLQEGNLQKFKKNAIKINNQITDDISYIICSCESCYDTLKRIIDKKFQSKLIRIDEFLELNFYKLPEFKEALYFKPLLRKEKTYLPENTFLLYKKGICSLMENFFILKYKKQAEKIAKETFASADKIKNKVIFTSCLLSKWGLEKEINIIKSNAKVYSYSEYIELLNSDNG